MQPEHAIQLEGQGSPVPLSKQVWTAQVGGTRDCGTRRQGGQRFSGPRAKGHSKELP